MSERSKAVVPPVTYLSLLLLALGVVVEDEFFKYILLLVSPWFVFSAARNFAVPEGGLLFFVYLYTVTYPTFLMLGDGYQGVSSLLNVACLFLFGFISGLLIAMGKLRSSIPLQSDLGFIYHEWVGVRICFLVPTLTLIIVIIAVGSGLQSKREIVYGVFGYFGALLEFSQLLFTLVLFFLCSRVSDCVYSWRLIILLVGCGFLLMVTVGERDLLFRFVFVMAMFYLSKSVNVFRASNYIIFMLLALSAMSLSQQMKSLFLTGQFHVATEVGARWLFHNEFSAGMRNLHYIILLGELDGGQGLIWGDILRFIRADLFVGDGVTSATQWFNEIYRVAHGIGGTSGWGFGLVAEFYVSGGSWGALFGGFILGVIISILALMLWGGVSGRVFLFIIFASLIYSLRADVANLLALSIKWAIVPYCIIRGLFFLFARIKIGSIA